MDHRHEVGAAGECLLELRRIARPAPLDVHTRDLRTVALEHLRDPWRIVSTIREGIDADGCLLACIPNAQHWSVQMRLATGLFRYEDSGLMDRTHVRWFTRVTMIEMFMKAGWKIETAFSRQIPTAAPPALMAGIQAIAAAGGADPEQAAVDANAFQYLFKVVPV